MGTCTHFIPDDPLSRALPQRRPPPPPPVPPPPPSELPSTPPPPPPDEPPAVPLRAAVEFARIYPTIRRTVRVLHPDQSTADDVTQEAALRVLVRWDRFTPPLGTVDVRRARRQWAAMVALHVVQEWRSLAAAKKRAGEIVTDPEAIEAATRGHVPSAEDLVIGRETLQELEDATTPERWRAFYMRHAEGHTAARIAAEMGARVNTVYRWIHDAADDLRAYLARRDAADRRGK